MRTGGALTGTGFILLMCAGFVVLSAGNAFAVAGKVVDASAATSLAGTEVKFDLSDGDPVTTTVGQDATFEVPPKVTQSSVKACYRKVVTESGETKWEPIPCGWFSLPSGAGLTAKPVGDLLGGTILRFNGFGGYNMPYDVKNVQGTGSFSNSTFSKLDTTNGYTAGAGIDWKWSSGWVFGANYQYLHEGIKGQTVQETFTSGGFSSTNSQTLTGGSLSSNVVAFNFGYEWDCWKVLGRTLSLGLGAGPVIGSTTFSTFNQNSMNQFVGQNTTKGATGLNTQGTLRYSLGGGFSTFFSYQYVHLHSEINRITIGGSAIPIQGDINSNIFKVGLSYDLPL